MPLLVKRLMGPAVVTAGLFAGLCGAGCGWLTAPERPLPLGDRPGGGAADGGVAEGGVSTDAADRAVLTRATDDQRRSVWIHAVDSPRDDRAEAAWRWRYPDLEDLLARPVGRQPDWRRLLGDENLIVATNAAIAMARSGDNRGADQLARAVRTPEVMGPMRCAAIESLARLDGRSAVSLLGELIDQYGDTSPESARAYRADLHGELIRGLARHVDPADEPRLVAALRSPAADVRLEALRAWPGGQGGSLPVEVEDMRTDADRRVRAAAVETLAARRHPDARLFLADALQDHELTVRVAAIAGLGELGGVESRVALEQLLDDPSEAIRAAAVAALDRAGAEDLVLRAESDRSWRVRVRVAEALAGHCDPAAVAVANRLLGDPSAEVQARVVAATAEWPLEQAGPILLTAMGSQSLLSRRAAATELTARWPEAARFAPEGPPQRREEVLHELRERFAGQLAPQQVAAPSSREAVGPPPTASITPQRLDRVEQLIEQGDFAALGEFGPGLVEAVERLVVDRQRVMPEAVYREVLPQYGADFAALAELASSSVSERRRAAEALAVSARQRPLGRLAVGRLAQLGVAEADDLVWQGMLDAAADDASEPSIRLAYAGLSHPAAEVRRRACEHLAAHPDPAHAKRLLPALDDRSEPVVLAAVRALGAAGRPADAEPLRQLLRTKSEPVRLETAVALVRLGDPMGATTLEQLAESTDAKLRYQVAVAMGESGDPSLVPALVALLDDRPAVCAAAMEGLTQLVGRDVSLADTDSPPSTSQRVQRWKEWFAQHPDAASRTARVDRP